MRLLIVDRNRPDVYELLMERFAGDAKVRVMFDRRLDVAPPAPTERRNDEDDSKANLWDQGYIVVVLPD